jgi:hypothetical protein
MTEKDYHINGIPLEKQVAHFLVQKMHLGNLVEHNDFNPKKYPNENSLIVDSRVADKVLIEMTNPKESTWMDDSIMMNKLDYFHRADPKHLLFWVLIVSFTNFSQYIHEQINKLNIILVVLNIHADKFSHNAVIKRLFKTRLYGLIKRVFKSRFAPIFNKVKGNNQTLDKHIPFTVKAIDVQATNNLHQHQSDTQDNKLGNEIDPEYERKIVERAKLLGLFDDYGFS